MPDPAGTVPDTQAVSSGTAEMAFITLKTLKNPRRYGVLM
jgi:hypothetical protein